LEAGSSRCDLAHRPAQAENGRRLPCLMNDRQVPLPPMH
jgi:hypothetical protein